MRVAIAIALIGIGCHRPIASGTQSKRVVFECLSEREAMAQAFYEGYGEGYGQGLRKPQKVFAAWYGKYQRCKAQETARTITKGEHK